jgi:hypothetical protein
MQQRLPEPDDVSTRFVAGRIPGNGASEPDTVGVTADGPDNPYAII